MSARITWAVLIGVLFIAVIAFGVAMRNSGRLDNVESRVNGFQQPSDGSWPSSYQPNTNHGSTYNASYTRNSGTPNDLYWWMEQEHQDHEEIKGLLRAAVQFLQELVAQRPATATQYR